MSILLRLLLGGIRYSHNAASQPVVAHAFNPCTWKAEAGRYLSLRPAWSTEQVLGQPELHRENCLKNKRMRERERQRHTERDRKRDSETQREINSWSKQNCIYKKTKAITCVECNDEFLGYL